MAEFQEEKLKLDKVEWLTQYVQGIRRMHTEANFAAFQLSIIFYVNLNDLFISLSLFFIFCLPEKSEDLPQITGKSSFLMESSENPTLIYPILAQLNLILMQDQKKFPKLYNISWL